MGNDGPEAGAGLGGNLDGSDPSKNGGGLWKATSYNGRTKITTKTSNAFIGDQVNVQAIPPNKKDTVIKINNADGELVRREIPVPDEKLNAIEPIPNSGNNNFLFHYYSHDCSHGH